MNQDQRFVSMVNGSPVAAYSCDESGRLTFFNKAAEDLWGRKPELNKDLWCGSSKIFYLDGKPMPLEDYPMANALKNGRDFDSKEIIIERPLL